MGPYGGMGPAGPMQPNFYQGGGGGGGGGRGGPYQQQGPYQMVSKDEPIELRMENQREIS